MKKNFIALGLICAAAFTLTNCSKELENSSRNDSPFEIIAGTGTKTTNDGITTEWASGDQLSVFYAEAGTTNYSGNTQFTYEAGSGSTFKTTDAVDLSGAANFDWYAIYPYTAQIETPANTSKGWVTVGGTSQIQNGNDSKSHLSGKVCPLYGVIENVANTDVPTFTMHHLTSVIEVTVKNNSGSDLLVSSVSFSAQEYIAGTYYINFSEPASGIVYTSSGADYVSKTATLSVNNGDIISNGSSAKFYIAVKPFVAAEGTELKITVNDEEKSVIVPSGGKEFKAGVINKVSFTKTTASALPKYSTGFETDEGFTAANAYNAEKTDGPVGKQWKMRGTVSTSNKITDANSVALRYYNSDSNTNIFLQTEFDTQNVTKVEYKAKAAASNSAKLLLDTYYSIDGGTTWTIIDNAKELTSSAASYSFDVPSSPSDLVRIKFKIADSSTKPTKSSAQLTIDDIIFY